MQRSIASTVVMALVVAAITQGVVGGVTAQEDNVVTLEITLEDDNDQPVGGVDISVTWDDGDGGPVNRTTSADGRALVDVPEGANYEVTVDDEDYVRNRPFRVFDAEGGPISIPVSESGRATVVVEGANGPVEDATVSFRDAAGEVESVTTNEDGEARSSRLEQGEYTVRVIAPRHLRTNTSISITSVEKTRTVSVQRANVDATFQVFDDHESFDDPQPVRNANVRIESLGTTLTTDEDGTATLSVPVNQRYRVEVSKEGYDSQRLRFRVNEEPTDREVTIQRTPSIDIESVNDRVVLGESTVVTVTDEYDQRVEGATISVDGETIGQTDEQGQLRVPVETAGSVTIEASHDDATASVSVEGVDPDAEDETPTRTPTATPDEGTPTPTPTETPGDDGAGFGLLVTVLGILAALAATRR